MKKCNECGQSYPDGVDVCPNCKTRLVEKASPPAGSEAPIAKRLLIFSVIALVYCVSATIVLFVNLQKTVETHIVGTGTLLGMGLWLLSGIPMGICLALCLKGTAAKIKTVILGSILCGTIMALAMHIGFYAVGDSQSILWLAYEVMIAGIPCFLIAWLTGRILRKKNKK